MGVYTETLLVIKSQDTDFIERLFLAISPGPKLTAIQNIVTKSFRIRPKPTAIQNIVYKLFRIEHDHSIGLMQYLLPMPEELEKTVTNGYSGESPEWRNWRKAHWGAPYDVGLEYCERKSDGEIEMRFTSYNGFLSTGLTNASKAHRFSFKLLYHCDHGGVGHHTESDQVDFDFPGEMAPAEAGISKELIDAFDLEEQYKAYVEEL